MGKQRTWALASGIPVILLWISALSIPTILSAQTGSGIARHINWGASLPVTCSPSTGDVFFLTTGSVGMYQCTATNTWSIVPQGGGGTGCTFTGGSSNDILIVAGANCTTSLATADTSGNVTALSLAVNGASLGSTKLAVTGHVLLEGVTSTGATGTGSLVFSSSPSLTTPSLGTPSVLVLTNATGLPPGGVTSSQGSGAKFQFSTGATTTGDCAKFDSTGNTVDQGSGCVPAGSTTAPVATGVEATDNANLQTALNTAGISTVIVPNNGTPYAVNNITIPTGVTLYCPSGAIIQKRTNGALVIVGGSNVGIIDCVIDGNTGGGYTGVDITATGYSYLTISGNTIKNAGGIGLQLIGMSNVSITQNSFTGNISDAIFWQNASAHYYVAGNYIDTTAATSFSHGIGVHSTTASNNITDFTITGNVIHNGYSYCIEVGAFGGNQPTNWNISNNVCTQVGTPASYGGYSISGASYGTLSLNSYYSATAPVLYGIEVVSATQVTVSANNVNGGQIYFNGTTYSTASDNTCVGGLYVGNSNGQNTNYNTFTSNVCTVGTSNSASNVPGIHQQCNFSSDDCSHNVYANNQVYGSSASTAAGVYIENDAGVTTATLVLGNAISGFSGGCIALAAGSGVVIDNAENCTGSDVINGNPYVQVGQQVQKGTLANIPGTCTTGMIYQATDQTASAQIYACSSANTWTLQGGSGSGNTTSTSLTTNTLPKANGANSIVNSSVTDNGTTVSTTEGIASASISTGSAPPSYTPGTGGVIGAGEGTCPTPTSSIDFICDDAALGGFAQSINGGAYALIGGGSSGLTVGTTTITSGTNGRIEYNNSGVLGEYASIPIANGGTNATSAAAGTIPNATSSTAASWTSAAALGGSGTTGSLAFGNATSGTVTLQTVTGALGSAVASFPANTGTVAELNYAQTFSATQTFTASLIASGASHTSPFVVVASSGALPATCTAGELGFVTGATAGQNIYECGSTNTWTQQLNSGGGGSGCAVTGGAQYDILVNNGSSGCSSSTATVQASGNIIVPNGSIVLGANGGNSGQVELVGSSGIGGIVAITTDSAGAHILLPSASEIGTCTIGGNEMCVGGTGYFTSGVLTGASGTLGYLTMGNATSGTVTIEPVTGALGTVTASLPANTGVVAELNLAQTFSAAQTFSSAVKTTTIDDANGNPFLLSTATASAVDSVTITNAATANPATVTVTASGSDSNINLNLVSKGTGTVQCNGSTCGSGGSYTSPLGTINFSGSTADTANTIDGIPFDVATSTTVSKWDDFLLNANSTYGALGLGWYHSSAGTPGLGASSDWVAYAQIASGATSIAGHPGVTSCKVSANSAKCSIISTAGATGGGPYNAADLWGGIALIDLDDATSSGNFHNAVIQIGFFAAGGATAPCNTALTSVGGCAPAMYLQNANTGSYNHWLGWGCTGTPASPTCDATIDTGVAGNNGWFAVEIKHLECVTTTTPCDTGNTIGYKVSTSLSGLSSASLVCLSSRASGAPAACTSTTYNATHLETTAGMSFFISLAIPASGDGDGKVVNVDGAGLFITGLSR